MENFINSFIEQNKKINDFLNEIGRDYENSDNNLVAFKDFLNQTKYNAALGIELANFLQFLNNENNFSDFQLGDISRLFDSLLKLQEFNIDTYLEAAHFEWSVMENTEKAKITILEGIEKANEKIDELRKLLKTIDKED